MQRTEPDGMIVIACDFCLRDWDGQEAMVEGHHGSVICLECLKKALKETDNAKPETQTAKLKTQNEGDGGEDKFNCTLCLRRFDASVLHWEGVAQEGGTKAVLCEGCLKLARKTFARSPLVEWDGTS